MDALFDLTSLPSAIEKYVYLRKLALTNKDVYYRLLMDHTEAVLPYIYTPTVGEACQRYHKLNLTPQGLYISLSDKGHILDRLKAWPQQKVRVVVVTDGERILGLGDLGTGGMGISEGKITLYSVAAGVDPDTCLPVCLDVGTNNQALLDDPTYPGIRHPRATGGEYDSFLDEFVQALQQWQPHVLLQFEDFGGQNAFRLLERYGSTHCCFNDDIQGTAAITLAALLAAVKTQGVPLQEQRIVFLGAGEAGTGIGELVAYSIHRTTGMSRHEARQHCYFLDSQGLVTSRRENLAHHKLPFAHDLPPLKDLVQVVEAIKPTVLIGVSTIAGAFNEPVVRAMARLNDHPIIMPLSNPTSKSECTFEQAFNWTGGRVIFASGSPFDPITVPGGEAGSRVVYPAQSNNAYIFPALGMATIITRASNLSDETFLVAANALAELVDPPAVLERGELFPPFDHILDVSVHVAARVAMHLVSTGAGVRPSSCSDSQEGRTPEEDLAVWKACVRSHYWQEAVAVMAQESRQNKKRGMPIAKL